MERRGLAALVLMPVVTGTAAAGPLGPPAMLALDGGGAVAEIPTAPSEAVTDGLSSQIFSSSSASMLEGEVALAPAAGPVCTVQTAIAQCQLAQAAPSHEATPTSLPVPPPVPSPGQPVEAEHAAAESAPTRSPASPADAEPGPAGASDPPLGPTFAAASAAPAVRPAPADPVPFLAATSCLALAWALYRRLRAGQVQAQAARVSLLAAVRAVPGATLADLARATGLHAGTVRYHVQLLAEFHAVVLHRDGRALRVFENGGRFAAPERAHLARVARPAAARVLAPIPPEGIPASSLARQLGVSRQAAHKHLRSLAEAGLVVLERRGGRVVATPIHAGALP